jgi:hypothetical protein
LKGKKMEIKHAKESGHWYTREGAPAYTVKSAKGEDRPTNLRDARKLNLVPSVTTILGVAAKPGLEIWKQNQVLLAALTLPRQEGESESDWVNRIIEDSKEQGKQAAEFGTAIHAEIQAHFEGRPYSPGFKDYVEGAVAAISSHFNDWEWISEKSFAHELGYGGKCDLFIRQKMNTISPGSWPTSRPKTSGQMTKLQPTTNISCNSLPTGWAWALNAPGAPTYLSVATILASFR